MRASEDARAYPAQIGGHLIQKLEPKSYDWYTRLPPGHAAPDLACTCTPGRKALPQSTRNTRLPHGHAAPDPACDQHARPKGYARA